MGNYAYFENEINEIKKCFDIKRALLVISKIRLDISINGDKNLLKLASDFADFCYSKNNLDARILIYKLYFNTLSGKESLESAKIIKVINSGLKYFKANDIELYYQIVFVYAKFSTNEKQLKKYLKIFEDGIDNDICKIYLADLYLGEDNEKTLSYLNKINKRVGSVMYFEVMFKYFLKNVCSSENIKKLICVIKWAELHNIDTIPLINKNIDALADYAFFNIEFIKKLYEKVSDDKLLSEICKYYIGRKEIGKRAFKYYKLAMKKQVEVNDLNKYFIRGAFENGYENISHYFMVTYLENNVLEQNIESFIYHVMIVNEHLNDLIEESIGNIEGFIKKSFNKNIDEYVLSTYVYALLNKEKFGFDKNEFELLEKKIFENLFAYKIVVGSKFEEILITYKDRAEIKKYSVIDSCAYIVSPTPEFSYYLCDKDNNIVSSEVSIKPLIYSYSIDIYLYFYKNGFYSDEFYIFLANYMLEQNVSDEDIIKVFTKALEINGLDSEFNKRLNTYVAQINILSGNYEDAIKNISKINYENISKTFLEKVIEAYINTKKYDEVYEIISQMAGKISDEIILSLLKIDDEKVLKRFSNVFLNRVIYGLEDKALLSIVLKHSDMTFDMQGVLLEKSKNIGVKEPVFIKKYFENIIDKKLLTKEVEEFVFENLELISDKELEKYFKLVLYNVINNEYKVTKNTYKIIEKTEKSLDICLILIKNFEKNTSFDINEIAKKMSDNNLVIDDENILKLLDEDIYYRKHKFFTYTVANAENVYLYYKLNDVFKKIKMDYYGYNYYYTKIVMFFGEEVEYYFVTERASGSVETKKERFVNKNDKYFVDNSDNYSVINNALIAHNKYQMSEFEKNIELLLDTEELNIDYLK